MIKGLIIIGSIILALFILSLIIYFFNLDMKLASKFEPILIHHYDKIKRDRRF
ncbi:MAG: hypothetical protein E6929_14155 [Clostridium sp.]|nr:hypothetical protein [Clostridium sp.]